MKRSVLSLIALAGAVGLGSAFFVAQKNEAPAPAAQGYHSVVTAVAAPGRVEPVSEEIEVTSSIPGKLKSVMVQEGARVRKGQVLAVIDNAEYQARVAVARAQLAQAQASMQRLLNGARSQERREAQAAIRETEAVLENTRAELARREELHRSGDISRAELERAGREVRVAKSRLDAAVERHAFVDADAREDERMKAEADVALAQARLDEAIASFDKTFVRSPIDGVVLRRHLRTGENVTDSAPPIVTLGDNSVLRVRAEVDETDVARVRVGQRVYVTATAYGDRKFTGRVVRVGQVLGKKNVRTERPSERVDTKILETLIELDPGQTLPAGLPVDAFIG